MQVNQTVQYKKVKVDQLIERAITIGGLKDILYIYATPFMNDLSQKAPSIWLNKCHIIDTNHIIIIIEKTFKLFF